MRIVAGFHSRDDDWILPFKLQTLSKFCDRIVVLLDRSIKSERICQQYPKVEVSHWIPERDLVDDGPDGPICMEGAMRQRVFDLMAAHNPDYMVFGDSDEVPTPEIGDWLRNGPDPTVDLWYMDWVNLYQTPFWYAGGDACPWSFETPGSNKKGVVLKYNRRKTYRYDLDKVRHCRLEPNPIDACRAVFDGKHRLIASPKLIHWKWSNWDRWLSTRQAYLPKYNTMFRKAWVRPTRRDWLWPTHAEDILAALPDPIAVVGNGAIKSNYGREIDNAATVIRFNNFRTLTYERQVGNRTDLWVTNCFPDVDCRPWPGAMMTVYTEHEQPDKVGQWLGEYPHMAIPRASLFDAARRVQRMNPSTGMTVLCALDAVGKRCTAYGFDGFKTGHYWDAEHVHNHERSEAGSIKQLTNVAIRP